MRMTLVLALVVLPSLAIAGPGPIPTETTPAGRQAAARGLAWLVRAQSPQGWWGLEPGSPPDIGTTCVATLALLSSGSTPSRGRHARNVSRALDWVLAQCALHANRIPSTSTSLITSKLGNEIHGFLTTLLLAEMLGMEDSRAKRSAVKKALRTMVGIIAGQQRQDGSWNSQSFAPLLATASAWTALRASYMAGVPAGSASVLRTLQYVEQQLDRTSGVFRGVWGGSGGGYRFFGQAAALRVLYGMGRGEQATAQKGVEALFRHMYQPYHHSFISEGENYMAGFYASQALFQDRTAGRKLWRRWFAAIQRTLVGVQNGDGSWRGTACITSRVFCSACAILTLQVPYRRLPGNEY